MKERYLLGSSAEVVSIKCGTYSDAKQREDIARYKPDCVIFHLGINDLREDDCSVQTCVDNALETINATKSTCPATKIVVSAPIPRPDNKSADIRHQLFSAQLQSELEDADEVAFVNHASLARDERSIRNCYDKDRRHLSRESATAIVASTISKAAKSLLGIEPRGSHNEPNSPNASPDRRRDNGKGGAYRRTYQRDNRDLGPKRRDNYRPNQRRSYSPDRKQPERQRSRGDEPQRQNQRDNREGELERLLRDLINARSQPLY